MDKHSEKTYRQKLYLDRKVPVLSSLKRCKSKTYQRNETQTIDQHFPLIRIADIKKHRDDSCQHDRMKKDSQSLF